MRITQRATLKALSSKLGRSQSDTLRDMIDEYAKALGLSPGKATIRVTVERVGELEY